MASCPFSDIIIIIIIVMVVEYIFKVRSSNVLVDPLSLMLMIERKRKINEFIHCFPRICLRVSISSPPATTSCIPLSQSRDHKQEELNDRFSSLCW
jgi:hypothetical protein